MESTPQVSLQHPHKAAWIVFLILLGAGLAIVLKVLAPFFATLLLGVVAAGLIRPWHLRLTRMLRGHRHTAAVIICVLMVMAVFVPLVLTAQAVSSEALDFYEMTTTQLTERSLLEMLEQRQVTLDRINAVLVPIGVTITAQDLYEQMTTLGVRLGGFFYRQGVSVAKHLARFLFGFTFWVIILYYLLVDGEAARSWFLETLPLPAEEQVLVSHRFMDMASSVVVGNGLAGVIQGLAGGLVFALLGLPGPALWGVVMFLLAFIPVVGISFVYVPGAIILLLAGETGKAALMFFPLIVLATIVEYGLKPMLVGRRAHLHTLLVFLSLVGGLQAFGAVGLLLGPLMMTAFLTLVSIYRDHYRPAMVMPGPADDGGTADETAAPQGGDEGG